MSNQESQQLSPVKQALLEIRALRTRLQQAEHEKTEPIAIVGMGLRLPGGASDPTAFWRLLREGVDATIEVPSERWDLDEYYDPDPDAPNKMYVREGGFLLEDVSQFEPTFFGISPREAQSLDPKQRLLLEVSWEALENAGWAPDKLDGSRTGIFIGIGGHPDYLLELYRADPEIDAYMGPGATYSAAAGRLSYFYGFKGPAMAVDTACSSSLVTVHLACHSLRAGESDAALVGGVTLHLNPEGYITQCKLRMTSPDGRCKAFDAAGDGVGRGEGCGVVVLKRLRDALADGDNVLAVIHGSAVNQDGRTAGLTAPNGPSQQAVIRAALANARVAPHEVSYLEAHGTGTALGDPIEIQAAAAVYGEGRAKDNPLLVGSVKTNIGHLEEGAGVASLIKVTLMMQHKQIPPSLHLREPNGYIPWDRLPVQVNTALSPWRAEEGLRLAAISGFGWSGTNAHVIVGEAAAVEQSRPSAERPYHLLTLSARSDDALRTLARHFVDYLAHGMPETKATFPDICFTANTGRARFTHRLAVVGASAAEAGTRLQTFVAEESGYGVVHGKVRAVDSPDVAFLFTGQGSQYVGMGQELYDSQPTFRAAIDRCDELLRPHMDRSLLSLLYPEDGRSSIDETAYTQPALFALEYALAEMWQAWGIRPAAVMGHSVGEYVAACVAGVFSLEDGLRLIAERGRLMQTLPRGGVMAAVFANEGRVAEAIAPYAGDISIAAVNGPEIVVISGAKAQVNAVIDTLRQEEIRAWPLPVSHALHTDSMEPILESFEALAATVSYAAPRTKMVSLLTGDWVKPEEITQPGYWRRHMRDAVRFADGMAALYAAGYGVYLEVGPNPNLLGMGQLCVPEGEGVWIPSLREKREAWQQLMESIGMLFVQGVPVDWARIDDSVSRGRRRVPLPTYPFQRQRYWIEKAGVGLRGRGRSRVANQNPWSALSAEGMSERLVQQLHKEQQFSGEEIALVPRLVDVLARQLQEEALVASLHEWFYQIAWQRAPGRRDKRWRWSESAGRWLIFADEQGVGEALAGLLEARGQRIQRVFAASEFGQREDGQWQVDPSRPEDFVRLLQETGADASPLVGVVYLWSLGQIGGRELTAERLRGAQALSVGSALHLLQALERRDGVGSSPRLWLVTRGAQPATREADLHVAQAPVWGLGNVIRMEHPDLGSVLVDLDPAGDPEENASQLLTEIWQGDVENGVAFRKGVRYVARLVRAGAPPAVPAALHADGAYLITGGLGALGLQVARWLADNGAKKLALIGRSAPSEATRAAIGDLQTSGCEVLLARADVADEGELAAALRQVEQELGPLRGVVHAAGMLDDGILLQQEWRRFADVMAAKVEGAWNLHALTLQQPLDFFVLFSSIAATLGAPGQGNYAAANSFLDSLAFMRQAQGLPALSINWAGWKDTGMAADVLQGARRWQAMGIEQIAPEHGLRVLAQLLAGPTAQMVVLPVDWSRFLPEFGAGRELPLLREVAGEIQEALASEDQRSVLLERLRDAPLSQREELLRSELQAESIRILGLDPSFLVDPELPLMELGLDSLMAVQLRNAVSARLGRDLPATLLFNYPTLSDLSAYLLRELMPDLLEKVEEDVPLLAASARTGHEAIAIVGMSCRFPGANSVNSFWRLLHDGVDAISEVPQERWNLAAFYDPVPGAPGKMYTRWGGFLDDVDQFDPQFFGISPREAIEMDPQQRLLLEVSWEALENAGTSPAKLHGSQTGVYIGIGAHDYSQLQVKHVSPQKIGSYMGTGNSFSVAAGRLSYVLGLQGPSMAVDTACSSSLVALHLACKDLRAGDCDAALAGGVNLILSPEATVALSQARMMAEDGRCKTFDAAANGFVRSDGCGIVLLKRLSDALAEGDNVLAVIHGTAVNQDGRSQGLTAPNGLSQERVIRRALEDGNIRPADVSYVEAHGTGTALGDPIEVGALAATYGAARNGREPLLVGSVKTNVGHMETAAGIGGLLKVVLSLQMEMIPQHLHFHEPNPYIPWEQIPVKVMAAPAAWPRGEKARLAGLSSFGFSGTNAHVIIGEAPLPRPETTAMERPTHLLPLSARSRQALAELAGRYAQALAENGHALADFCFTAASGRAHFEHRLAIVAEDRAQLRRQLAAIAAGEDVEGVVRGPSRGVQEQPRVAFLFTGQGSQYVGMGRELYDSQPTFRAAIDRCDELLRPHMDRSLLSLLYPGQPSVAIDETAYTQPALFALEYALAQLWQAWGIRPAVVMGHSVGEYVAACVAGVFSLEDGLRLIAERGRLMQSLPGGAMAAVFAGEDTVAKAIEPFGGELSIAAVNGARHVVISGGESAVAALVDELQAKRIKARHLTVSHAFHSPMMEPMLDEFEEVAATVRFKPPEIGLVSNVSGQMVGRNEMANPSYWRNHVRRPVRFADGMATLNEQGYRLYLEVGPEPTLLGMGRRCVEDNSTLWLPSLRRGTGAWRQTLDTLAHLYAAGAAVDWHGFERDYVHGRRRIALPTYPFQRTRYWFQVEENGGARALPATWAGESPQPLLGQRLPSPLDAVQFEAHVSVHGPWYLLHRHLDGKALLPEAAHLEIAASAAVSLFESPHVSLDALVLKESPLQLGEEPQTVQTICTSSGPMAASFQIFALTTRSGAAPTWHLLASGQARSEALQATPEARNLQEIQARCVEIPVATFYDGLAQAGLVYSEHLQQVVSLWQGDGETLAQLRAPDDVAQYQLHPVLLDTCCQLIAGGSAVATPVEVAHAEIFATVAGPCWCHARIHEQGNDQISADLELLDETGQPLARLSGLRLRSTTPEERRLKTADVLEWLYEVAWRQSARDQRVVPTATEPGAWLILAGRTPAARSLAEQLTAAGDTCTVFPISAVSEAAVAVDGQAALAQQLQTLIRQMLSEDEHPLRGVINLCALDLPALEEGSDRALVHVLQNTMDSSVSLLQALDGVLAEMKPAIVPRLWLVTRGAQYVSLRLQHFSAKTAQASLRGLEGQLVAPLQASFWGLGRTIALEHPKLFGGLIDLDPRSAAQDVGGLLAELRRDDGEQQVALRDGERYVARLIQSEQRLGDGSAIRLRPDGAYLVTGGLGGLGLLVARWLVERGARRLILLGRTPLPPRNKWQEVAMNSRAGAQIAAVREMEEAGATVHLVAADVGDEAQLSTALASYAQEGRPPIRGVVHAAGIIRDSSLLQMASHAFGEVMRPKVAGAWLLHHHLQDAPLDFFILFSSVASMLGSAGQANYAAANAFLEGLAHYRRSQGQPALSINWGPWSQVGMAALAEREGRRQRLAEFLIPPQKGLDVLGRLLGSNITQIGVLPVPSQQWRRLTPVYSAFLDELIAEEVHDGAGQQKDGAVGETITAAPREARMALMADYLRQVVGQALIMEPTAVDMDRNMMELGLDSIMIMEMIQRLDHELDLSLFPREIFERPSVNELAEYLVAEVERLQQASVSALPAVTIAGEEVAGRQTQEVPQAPERRNPSAVFLLSSPRAGSTLLRVMLAGHPLLFSPPELHLLPFHGMGQRQVEVGHSYLNQGLQRAIMEAMGVDAAQSDALLDAAVKDDRSVPEIYRWLQDAVKPRILVDKSPSYALELQILERAEHYFDKAKYVHLVRHPYAVIDSIVRNRLDKLYRSREQDVHKFGEQLWATMNGNILDFLGEIDPARHHLVTYERLVREPEQVMRELANFLELPFDAALLTPYQGARMKDREMAVGDPDFFKFREIDATKAETWRHVQLPRRLGSFARRVAAELAYELPWPLEPALLPQKAATMALQGLQRSQAPPSESPLSFGQERLLFMDLLDPGNATYNLPIVVRLSGALDVAALQKSLETILARHEVLRTGFRLAGGQATQTLIPAAALPWEVIDVQEGPPLQRDNERRRLTAEMLKKPFDLDRDVKLRARLLRLAPDEHVLILVVHHIAADGWSTGILLHEMSILYEAYTAERPSPLPDPAIQYADFARWQRQPAQEERMRQSLAYWSQNLAGAPVLALPTDRPRPPIQSYRGDRMPVKFSAELSRSLKDLSRREGTTLFMTLLAGFQALLFRYTGQEDIVVGSPVAGRMQPETRNVVGFFVNNVVLRSDLSGNPSFRELLKRTRQTAVDAYQHQELSFDRLLQVLQPARDLSHSPLFQVMFALQNMPIPQGPQASVAMERLTDVWTGTSMFDLFVPLWDTEDGLTGQVEYSTDLFEAATIRRMMAHFERLLTAALANPEQPVAALPLLDEAERRQLLIEWNRTGAAFPEESCLHHIFEARVEAAADSIALTFGAEHLTYGELNERANRLAHHLQQLGVTTETIVGLYLERSVELVVALLGVLKAGGAYLPLDPAFPTERLNFMLSDSQARVLLTQESLRGRLEAGAKVQTVYLDGDWPTVAGHSSTNPASAVASRNLAYVIYTSGSTGLPKGVQLEHRGVVNFLASMRRQPGLDAADVLAAVTTLSFDIAVLEIFLPLTTGARVVMVSRAVAADGALLADLLVQEAVTVLQATPSTWRLLIASGWEGTDGLKALCGGEALPRDLADQLLQRCDALWNMYGPTETTIWSTTMRVESGEGPVAIGRPIANTTCYILDASQEPVPLGVAGELYIGGAGLARGYLNRPQLTAEKFVAHPFLAEEGAHLYRTGDRARLRADGTIDFLGRFDHQVKVRGFRIELGEIETVLNQHPAIQSAVVAVREDAASLTGDAASLTGDMRLVAYIVSGRGKLPPVDELRHFLGERLPDYMIPSHFVSLDMFPLTPNGKVDRRALPAPESARPDLTASFVMPSSDVEVTIAGLWQEALKIDRVGVDDNFFDLGGHSLLLAQVHNRLQETLGVALPIVKLFQYPTIKGLAHYLSAHNGSEPTREQIQERAQRQKAAFAHRRQRRARRKDQ